MRQASYRVMRRTAPPAALAVAGAELAPLLQCASCSSVGKGPAGAVGASRSCHVEPPASTDSALTVRRLDSRRAWGLLASAPSAASAASPPPAAALGGVSSRTGRGGAPELSASAAASAAAAVAMAALSECGPSAGGERAGDAAARAASPAASSAPARPSAAADGGRCCR